MLFLPDKLKFLKKSLIDPNKFYNNFEIWLNSKKSFNFLDIDGYIVFNAFLKENYSKSVDVFDYRAFIIENREIIEILKTWISLNTLPIERFYLMFQVYYKNNIERFSRKSSGHILGLFYEEAFDNNFYFDKGEVDFDKLDSIVYLENENFKKLKKQRRIQLEKLKIESEKLIKQINVEELHLIEINNEENLIKREEKKNEIHLLKELNKEESQKLINEQLNIKNDSKYILNQKAKKREERRRYKRARFKRDVTYRIVHRLRTRITNVLNGKKKHLSSMNLLGCSPDFLKAHLEAQFTDGMSWDNYGPKGWHIDHIIPCASFDLNKIEEQKKCFHYSNLQPLWWYDNVEKADKLEWKIKR